MEIFLSFQGGLWKCVEYVGKFFMDLGRFQNFGKKWYVSEEISGSSLKIREVSPDCMGHLSTVLYIQNANSIL